MLRIAIMLIKDIKPALAAEPARRDICIGPPKLSAETDPETIFPIESSIKTVNL